MKMLLRFVAFFLLVVCLSACENEQSVGNKVSHPVPTGIQQQWMEQSWSEYIVTVKDPTVVLSLESINVPGLPIKKIKALGNNQYVVTLKEKLTYKIIFNALMTFNNVESVQPNFIYSIPKPVLNINDAQ